MSLFRKVELVEEEMAVPEAKVELKDDVVLENAEKINDPQMAINENLIKIIENIVEKYLQRKTIKPKRNKKQNRVTKKIQNGEGIKWIFK